MLIQPSQADVRRFFCGVYAKARTAVALEPMEMLVSQWINEHPEYHAELADVDAALAQMLPKRPRSFAQLGWHIANIADAFLEHENGIPLTFDSYMRVPEEQDATREKLIAYCEEMRQRMSDWFDGPGRTRDWSARADVYYGEQTMHEFMERTVWHAGQHSRQLMWVLEGLGIAPDQPLGPEVFAGLPMPESVWDDADPAKMKRLA
jgi:hypothetical protein